LDELDPLEKSNKEVEKSQQDKQPKLEQSVDHNIDQENRDNNDGAKSPKDGRPPPENPPSGSLQKYQSNPPEQTGNTEKNNAQGQGNNDGRKDPDMQTRIKGRLLRKIKERMIQTKETMSEK
jgi:hypothetical protein